ncbi:MAG TPA: sulfate reduction electron transfer complex DsrMKJOP subunit DsrJ [candidate division Zixibacteria bacterium]|nr:sulfate reduction electron transfer complex DsrMKJOP subunit DsrJ [candidate division Zixibacteria bacterium]
MHDAGKVIVGVIIFLVLISFPIWYNVASKTADYRPVLEKPLGEACVAATDYMTGYHMDLLNTWRDDVVRKQERFFTGPDGTTMEKSLSNTCLSCHVNKDKFCDQCHNYAGVDPYCWDCHIVPKEVAK